MKDPVSESGEFSYAVADTFQYLCFVITAFGKTIGIMAIDSIQDRIAPVMKCCCTGIELGQIGVFSQVDPIGKFFLAFF